MENLEKVEKLRKKADISYEEAKEILEECDWDLLDAVIKLESMGKLGGSESSYTTDQSGSQETGGKSPKQVAESYHNYDKNKKNEKGFLRTVWDGIVFLLKKGCDNTFIVYKDDKQIMSIPVLLLIILMICSFCLILLIMLIGLFCGYRYCFAGPDLGNDKVNNVMNKAGDAADSIREEVCSDAYPRSSEEINSSKGSEKKD